MQGELSGRPIFEISRGVLVLYCWIVFLSGGAGGALLMHLGDRPALRATQQQLAACQGDLQKSTGELQNLHTQQQQHQPRGAEAKGKTR